MTKSLSTLSYGLHTDYGNVGIGPDDPTHLLEVAGDIHLSENMGSGMDNVFGYGNFFHLGGRINNSDHLTLARYIVSADVTGLRVNIADYNGGDKFVLGYIALMAQIIEAIKGAL